MPSFRLKRGDATKVGSYVGSEGEIIYNTETKKVHVMDGSTSGGTIVAGTELVDAPGGGKQLKSGNELITIPSKLSELTNDSSYATTADIPTALSQLSNDAGFATTAQIPTALSALTNDAGFAVGTIPTSLSQLTNDAGLITAAEVPASSDTSVKGFSEWNENAQNPNRIIDASNITLTAKTKKIHKLAITPAADFSLNITGEASVESGAAVLQASYTSVDSNLAPGEIDGTGNNSGRIVERSSPNALIWYDNNGDGTFTINRLTEGRGHLEGKYDSGYLGYNVNWNPGGTLTTDQTLAISGDTEWKFAGGASNTANLYVPFYLGSSWPGGLTPENYVGHYARSVGFHVYVVEPEDWVVTTSFNDSLAVGESTKAVVLVELGASAYKASDFKIDGVSQTVKWLGGTAPQGTANANDVYTYEIFKTADSTYTVLGSYASYS